MKNLISQRLQVYIIDLDGVDYTVTLENMSVMVWVGQKFQSEPLDITGNIVHADVGFILSKFD